MAAKQKAITTDVTIVGGGHSGCTMAALLGAGGVNAVCIDQDDPVKTLGADFDGRTTAISHGSQRVIDAAGAWDGVRPQACPIKSIKITESGSPTLLEFLNQEAKAEAFGWIVENRLLRKSLCARVAALNNIQHIAPSKVTGFEQGKDIIKTFLADGREIHSKLVIGADGRNSFTREQMGIATRGWRYNQRALVCVIHHEKPHNHTAVEDFRGSGPFAILPMMDDEKGKHRSALVWTEHGNEKDSAVHWDEDVFNAAITERFPASYGAVRVTGKRFSYPLGLIHAQSYTSSRMALVADAAHGIHPIAGQGLNIGLRDIAVLSELLIDAKNSGTDLGGDTLLHMYESRRRADNMAMAAATDLLNKLFSNDSKSLRALRIAGLKMVQKIGPARRFFMKQAMGEGGQIPTLRGLKK